MVGECHVFGQKATDSPANVKFNKMSHSVFNSCWDKNRNEKKCINTELSEAKPRFIKYILITIFLMALDKNLFLISK